MKNYIVKGPCHLKVKKRRRRRKKERLLELKGVGSLSHPEWCIEQKTEKGFLQYQSFTLTPPSFT
jgi:hypothetical protein